MSDLKLNGQTINVTVKATLPAGDRMKNYDGTAYSWEAAKKLVPEGTRDTRLVDGMILSDGKREVVVLKRGLNQEPRTGTKVTLDGKPMTVVHALDVPDTFKEKVRYWKGMLPIMASEAWRKARGQGSAFW